jgi:uncharacterized protein (TIGR00255 family)
MIKSMTGFATASAESEAGTTAATVKSVNHRYLDVQMRLPAALALTEGALRALVQQRVGRGRVEVSVNVQSGRARVPTIKLDEAFAAQLASAVARAQELGVVAGSLAPGDLLKIPQAFSMADEPGEHADGIGHTAQQALAAALDALDVMRRREGELLQSDLEGRRAVLSEALERMVEAAQEGEATLQTRLLARVQELGVPITLDPTALAQEVVRFVARSDISEEVVRLRAHLAHWRDLVDGQEPCGRKLDFLLQEMNREVNTMGAKAEGLRVSELIVEMKSELERMREQVQNVE